MKKLLLITILSLGAISCQQKKVTTEKTAVTLTYSNLVDTATQDEVQKALTAAGISEQNVASFLESVALFNQTVGDKAGLVPKGFVTIDSLLSMMRLLYKAFGRLNTLCFKVITVVLPLLPSCVI